MVLTPVCFYFCWFASLLEDLGGYLRIFNLSGLLLAIFYDWTVHFGFHWSFRTPLVTVLELQEEDSDIALSRSNCCQICASCSDQILSQVTHDVHGRGVRHHLGIAR